MHKNSLLRRITGLALGAALMASLVPQVQVDAAEGKTLTILHTNDVHARFAGDDAAEERASVIGAERYKTLIDETKAKGDTLVLDAGDATHGQTFVNLSEGKYAFEIMNKLGVQAMTLGNHEFNYGREIVQKNIDLAEFPVLGANIVDTATGEKPFESTTLIKYEGYEVGIFGMATPETKFKAHPSNTEGLSFNGTKENPDKATVENLKAVADEAIAALKEQGADVIVFLSHLGLDKESEITTYDLLDKVEGIDVAIDGHSHTNLPEGEVYNGTLIAQTGGHSSAIGQVVLTLNEDGTVASAVASQQDFEVASAIAMNEDMVTAIEGMKAEIEPILAEEVGQTDEVLDGVRENVRSRITNLSSMIAESMVKGSGADFAITNGGGIRDSIQPGVITMGDILTVLPFNNTLVVIEATGQQILDALTYGVSEFPNPAGHFSQTAGGTYSIEAGEDGNVITNLTIGGKPVDLNATYKLATNDFMATGGDGYEMFAETPVLAYHGDLADVFAEYVRTELPLKSEAPADDDKIAEAPKTGENTSPMVYVGGLLILMAAALVVSRAVASRKADHEA